MRLTFIKPRFGAHAWRSCANSKAAAAAAAPRPPVEVVLKEARRTSSNANVHDTL